MRRRLALLLALTVLVAGCSTRAQRLYRRAEAFFGQGKYELAAADYQALLRDSPRDPLADLALYKLAYLYWEEFHDPATAVRLYERLVQDYPQSKLVGSALMWMVYVQARQLQDSEAVLHTCQEIDQRLPGETRLRASARLELAGAYQRAGQVSAAAATLKQVLEQFSGQTETSTEAYFRLALLYRDALGRPQDAVKMLEALVKAYPDTPAGAKARQALGWQYYTLKSAEEKQRQEELKRLARVLPGVPALPKETHPSLELLAGLQALLGYAGASTTMPELLAVSGLAFQTAVDWGSPAKTLYFGRNPLPVIAEAWGFSYNAWTFASAQEGLLALAASLAQNRPVLMLYGARNPHWCLFVGYQPLQQQVYLVQPGQSHPSVVTAAEFAQGWPRSVGAQIFTPLPASGCQFALTQRTAPTSPAERIKSALLRGVLALDQGEVQGALAGRAAYEALAQRLEACGAGEAEATQQLARWAAQALPLLVQARQAAAAALEAAAPHFPAAQQPAVQETAKRYAQFAERWQALATNIAAAAAATGPTGNWKSLRQEVEALGADEQQTLRALRAAVSG